jgi:hypothetical protein
VGHKTPPKNKGSLISNTKKHIYLKGPKKGTAASANQSTQLQLMKINIQQVN